MQLSVFGCVGVGVRVCVRVCACVCGARGDKTVPQKLLSKRQSEKKSPVASFFSSCQFHLFCVFLLSLFPSSHAGDTFTKSNLTLEGFFSKRHKPSGVGLIEPD